MRGSKTLLVWGLALAVIGLTGALAAGIYLETTGGTPSGREGRGGTPRPDARDRFDGYDSNGQRIYYSGVGHDGPIERDWPGPGGMRGPRGRERQRSTGMSCVACHREDGRGGSLSMMGTVSEAPDIRYETLTSAEDTSEPRAWSDRDIAKAIRDGIEPGGEKLDPLMPRWSMDAVDMRDTIDYLKELSAP